MSIDPRLYGGTGMPDKFRVDAVTPPEQVIPEPAPALPAAAAFAGSALDVQGQAIRDEAARTKADVSDSVVAGFKLTDTASLLSFMQAPSFSRDPNFSKTKGEYFNNTPLMLSEGEFKFMDESQSEQEWQWKMQRIKHLREQAKIAGDNPVASALPAFLDPVYLPLDIATLSAAKVFRIGRVGAGIVAAGGAAGIATAAGEASPKDSEEVLLAAFLNGAATSVLYRNGLPMKADPDYPDVQLQQSAKQFQDSFIGPAPYGVEVVSKPKVAAEVQPDGTKAFKQIGTYDVLKAKSAPDEVLNDVKNADSPEVVAAAVEKKLETRAEKIGRALQWNINKSMSSMGTNGSRIADILTDNNSNLSRTSVESIQRTVRSAFTSQQRVFEDMMVKAMGDEGYGILKRITSPREARAKQQEISRAVQQELWRRDQLTKDGLPVSFDNVDPKIKEMADAFDGITKKALAELKASGVRGAENIIERTGWSTRRWDSAKMESILSKLESSGLKPAQASAKLKSVVAMSLRRANRWNQELANDVAGSIINRALRKGSFEDSAFSTNPTKQSLQEMRDLLTEERLPQERIDRIMEVFENKNAEAGKPGYLKRRMELDYKAAMMLPDGSMLRVTDLIDPDLVTNTDRYLDSVAGQVAWAKAGYKDANDIQALRTEFLSGVPATERKAAEELFDNVADFLSGRPVGQAMNEKLRMLNSYGRMISLANSGLWQVTEYATIMARYGLLKTTKYALKTMPGFRSLWDDAAKDKLTSTRLVDILSRQSSQDIRIRPFLSRFEDNYEIPVGSAAQLSLQQAEQLVPYINAMKYVHTHQANLSANLVVDRLTQAAKGNANAREALGKYGISQQAMEKLSREVELHGTDTSKWSDSLWRDVRPAFAKMMDEAVLHARLGDMPAFAKFDQVGKFIFTYRSFMLTAHNKILSGTIGREGAGGLTMLLAYQLPLSAMAVKAQAGMQGKELKDEDVFDAAMGQAGGLGMFAEFWGVVSGQRSQFGAPGLIPIDRLYSVAGDTATGIQTGDFSDAGYGLMKSLPLLPLIQPIRNLQNLTEE